MEQVSWVAEVQSEFPWDPVRGFQGIDMGWRSWVGRFVVDTCFSRAFVELVF